MKPISFEHLRHFMGGGRKKKDKESSFKRSDSFKRISIRKNYLDRGGKKKQQKILQSCSSSNDYTITKVSTPIISEEPVFAHPPPPPTTQPEEIVEPVPGESYDIWPHEVKRVDQSQIVKEVERTVIYIPGNEEVEKPSIVNASHVTITQLNCGDRGLDRKFSNDSAVELFPWGDPIAEMDRSPILRRRRRPAISLSPSSTLFTETDEMSSLSVSLGRIWMVAPMAMSPHSLELPRPAPPSTDTIHHSLDSGLKERRDEVLNNRLQTHYPKKLCTKFKVVSRTLSSSTQNSESKTSSSSTHMFSSKDSGFSFSVSVPKLCDLSSELSYKRSLLRNKRPKPNLSVSRDGYFKRTCDGTDSIKGRSRRKIRSDLYQVIVNRPPRPLKNLDPMMFVPPEKRKNSLRKKQSFKLTVQEIRNYRKETDHETLNRYETMPGPKYQFVETDSSVEQPKSKEDIDLFYSNGKKCNLREFFGEDFGEKGSDEIDKSASDSGSSSTERSSSRDYEYEDSDNIIESDSEFIALGISTVPKRKPVRRRRPAVSQKHSVTYVAWPGIFRTSSTLRYSKSCKKKGKINNFNLF